MLDASTLKGKVVIAAMDLAAAPGWDEISLRDIADGAGVALDEVIDDFPDKFAVLAEFSRCVDRAMVKGAAQIEREQTPRDAVFEVIMSRFDLMTPYKVALKSIVRSTAMQPREGAAAMWRALGSQSLVLETAGIDTGGLRGLSRQTGLAVVYADVFRTWLSDDDAGMARTMSLLDKRLRAGERTLGTFDEIANSMKRMTSGLAAVSPLTGACKRGDTPSGSDMPAQSDAESAPTAPGAS